MTQNEHQTRALWATALHQLADAINQGIVEPPHDAHFYSHDVSPRELLHVADNSYKTALRVTNANGPYPSVTVPVGELLGLKLDWIHLSVRPGDATQALAAIENYKTHNTVCVPLSESPDGAVSATFPGDLTA
jgi:hypothetical protein